MIEPLCGPTCKLELCKISSRVEIPECGNMTTSKPTFDLYQKIKCSKLDSAAKCGIALFSGVLVEKI